MLKITESLKLAPGGSLLGGTLSLTADPATGVVEFDLAAQISMFFSIPIARQGSFRVDPKDLLSANCKKGKVFAFGSFRARVVLVADGTAVLDAGFVDTEDEISEVGKIFLDVSQAHIRLKAVNAQGKIHGVDAPLVLNKN